MPRPTPHRPTPHRPTPLRPTLLRPTLPHPTLPHPVAAVVAALVLTVALGGCSAVRDRIEEPPRTEDGVPVARVMADAVLAAVPDAQDVGLMAGRDGFAWRLGLTVHWPDDVELDSASVAAGAVAICENLGGFDYVDYGFYRHEADERVSLGEAWDALYPGAGHRTGSRVSVWESDCPTILG